MTDIGRVVVLDGAAERADRRRLERPRSSSKRARR